MVPYVPLLCRGQGYTGRACIGHNHTGRDCLGHSYMGQNSRRAAAGTKTVFLIRHGESRWNKAQHDLNLAGMAGDNDHPLNLQGIEQVPRP